MTELIQLAILGIGVGAAYGASGLGLVLTYRGAGILNFAHGAMGMVGAYVFALLRLNADVPAPIAIGCGVLTGAVLGVAVHVLLMQPLRRAAALMRIVATLAVMAVLQEIAILTWGSATKLVPTFLPVGSLELGAFHIGRDRLYFLAIGIVLALALTLLYGRTRFGMATTAIVENRRAAAALGWSPSLIALANWALGGALAAVAGILIVPAVGLNPTNLTLLVIPALAAALIGRFQSFWLTILGGLIIGMGESIVSTLDIPGIARAVPFVAIALVVVLRGSSLPVRGEFLERLPTVGTGRIRWWAVIGLPAALLLLSLALSPRWVIPLTTTFAVAIILLSLVVLTGYAGQLSLAQYSLAGFGVLVTALTVHHLGWDLAPAMLLGVLASLAMGVLVGAPSVRTRGVNLAIVTLVLGQAIYVVLLQNQSVIGSPEGTPVGEVTFLGWEISAIAYPSRYLGLTLAAFVLCAVVAMFIRRSRVGRRLVAVRENERAAAAMGINVRVAKLYAFAISSAMAAIGGMMIGFQTELVNYTSFDVFNSIHAVLMNVLGGVGYVVGVPFGMTFAEGSILQTLLDEIAAIREWITLIGAVGLLIVVLTHQDGFGGLVSHMFSSRSRKRPTVPLPTGDGAARGEVTRVRPATLEVRDLTVRYGGVTAVEGVDITVRPGEVVGLIGPNGAGKTSLVDAVSGHVSSATGSVRLDGRELIGTPPHVRVRAGLARTFQSLELYEGLTVEENLLAACDDQSGRAYAGALVGRAKQTWTAPALAAIAEFGLEEYLGERPDGLPHGVRRLVAVARGVAQAPSVLLLDEPASGISQTERAHLATLIRRLADTWGMGILLIEHDVGMVMNVCDRVTVISQGRVLCSGTPDEVRNDPAVIEAYLGSDAAADAGSVGEERVRTR